MVVSTCKLHLYQEIYSSSRQFPFWSECDVAFGFSQWRPLFVDSRQLIARSQNRSRMCEIHLSCPARPSRWVLCISMQWLRLKGCHVCDECPNGEICSLQHVCYRVCHVGSPSGASLIFGVQCASATNWFSRVNSARDNGIRLYIGTGAVGACSPCL